MVEMIGFNKRKTRYLNEKDTWPIQNTMSLIWNKALSMQVGIQGSTNRKLKRVVLTLNKEVRNMDRTKNARKRIGFNQTAPYKKLQQGFNYQSFVFQFRVNNRISFQSTEIPQFGAHT